MPDTAARFAPAAAPERSARRRGSVLDVAPELACVQQPIVNLYLVGPPGAGDRAWVLVDAGLAFFGSRIVRAAAERFGPHSRPSAIVLTHGHFDHVGALPHLANAWDVPVYAHECELPYVTGESSYPPPDPAVGGGAMSLLSRFYPRGPINLGRHARALPGDGSVPGLPNWRWLATPGHSPGHVSFFRDADRVLLAGDAFVTTKQESALASLTQPQEVRRPPAYYTEDWQAARRSVEKLAGLEPEVAATGHGLPMYGARLRQELSALARYLSSGAQTRPPRGACKLGHFEEQTVRPVSSTADPAVGGASWRTNSKWPPSTASTPCTSAVGPAGVSPAP